MYSFVLQIAFFSSLGVVIYLISRAVPRVTEDEKTIRTPAAFDELLRRLPLSQIDTSINSFFEKSLHGARGVLMKLDKKLHSTLIKVKKNGNGSRNGTLKGGNIFENTDTTTEDSKD